MVLIKWEDKLSVGIKHLDEQHHGLVDIINELHEAMREGKGKDKIGEVIHKLFEYTKVHFKSEEDLFDKYNFPGAEKHKKEHNDFVIKVSKYKEEFTKRRIFLSVEVMDYLNNWLLNHISGSDKEYSDFFISQGVS